MRELALRSGELRRRVGVLLDRKGAVSHVFVGDASKIELPELKKTRAGGRLSGLRWLVTTLRDGEPARSELNSLVRRRLDLLLRIRVEESEPLWIQEVHLAPVDEEGRGVHRVGPQLAPHEVRRDLLEFLRALEQEFERAAPKARRTTDGRRLVPGLLVAVGTEPRHVLERGLGELRELAQGAGLDVKGEVVQRRQRLDPQTLLGRGKVSDLNALALTHDAEVVVFDCELAPRQQVALEDLLGIGVRDRTQLILDLFAQRARTHAGKLQVECAQLRYQLPRLLGRGDAMTRIGGGKGAGFGRTKGAGEKKLEIDRRRIRDRISQMEKELDRLGHQRQLRRRRRAKNQLPHVALVGYTNVGKSTLFNRITGADVLAKDQLFASLDPTLRQRRLPGGRRVVLSDTVGFIRDLPEDLLAAFAATLDELADASLLIHVADASDEQNLNRIESVRRLLEELGLGEVPELLVFNKADLLEEPELLRPLMHTLARDPLLVSAKEDSLEGLLQRVEERLAESEGPDVSVDGEGESGGEPDEEESGEEALEL